MSRHRPYMTLVGNNNRVIGTATQGGFPLVTIPNPVSHGPSEPSEPQTEFTLFNLPVGADLAGATITTSLNLSDALSIDYAALNQPALQVKDQNGQELIRAFAGSVGPGITLSINIMSLGTDGAVVQFTNFTTNYVNNMTSFPSTGPLIVTSNNMITVTDLQVRAVMESITITLAEPF